MTKLDPQITGNVGLYFTCFHLSLLGWNVMPTVRNARGIDAIAYSRDAARFVTVQIKALSKRNPVPLGTSLDKVMGDFWVIVNNVTCDPTAFVLLPAEVRERAHRGEKDGRITYWLLMIANRFATHGTESEEVTPPTVCSPDRVRLG